MAFIYMYTYSTVLFYWYLYDSSWAAYEIRKIAGCACTLKETTS